MVRLCSQSSSRSGVICYQLGPTKIGKHTTNRLQVVISERDDFYGLMEVEKFSREPRLRDDSLVVPTPYHGLQPG